MSWIADFSGHDTLKIITVKFTAKPDCRTKVIELCTGMLEPSRNEPGCMSYNFFQDLTDENLFFFFEEWKDQEAIDSHNSSPHYRHFVAQFESLIIDRAMIKVFTVHHPSV
jgi:quinol monooxygenase YgiN